LVYVAFFLILYSAFKIITDGGNGKGKEEGVKTIKATIIGIIIMLSAWTIVNTVIYILGPNAKDEYGHSLSKT